MALIGKMHPAQERLQNILNNLVHEGRERGAQVAAYADGRLIVDVWAGVADARTGRPVDGDTLFPVFSTTKGIMATIIHRLVEGGALDYEMRIADVWPEFAANGKARITLRQVLNHTAGIHLLPGGITTADLGDWGKMCAFVADLTPQWPPGTQQAYHAITFGLILGETTRRVTGRPVARLLRDEILIPLGVEDIFIGIPDKVESRVAVLEECGCSTDGPLPDANALQSVPACMRPLYRWMNTPEARRTSNPAGSGIMSARAIARHYAALLPGGVDGMALLPPERVATATVLQRPDSSALTKNPPMRVGLGYALLSEHESAMGTGRIVFGTGGHGGSVGFADPEYGLAFAFTRNLFSEANTALTLADELRRLLRAS